MTDLNKLIESTMAVSRAEDVHLKEEIETDSADDFMVKVAGFDFPEEAYKKIYDSLVSTALDSIKSATDMEIFADVDIDTRNKILHQITKDSIDHASNYFDDIVESARKVNSILESAKKLNESNDADYALIDLGSSDDQDEIMDKVWLALFDSDSNLRIEKIAANKYIMVDKYMEQERFDLIKNTVISSKK
jgi:hypothetical protein